MMWHINEDVVIPVDSISLPCPHGQNCYYNFVKITHMIYFGFKLRGRVTFRLLPNKIMTVNFVRGDVILT